MVPRPSALDAVRADLAWRDWSFGFVSVDPALFDNGAERVNIMLPRRVLARLDAKAREANESRSAFIARLAIQAG